MLKNPCARSHLPKNDATMCGRVVGLPYIRSPPHVVTWMIDSAATTTSAPNRTVANHRARTASPTAWSTTHTVASRRTEDAARTLFTGSAELAALISVQAANAPIDVASGHTGARRPRSH